MKYYTCVNTSGNKIFVRGIGDDGTPESLEVDNFHPPIWIPSKNKITPYKTLYGYPVEQFDAGNIIDTRNWISENKDVDNFTIYGDIQPQYSYISSVFKKDINWNIDDIIIAYLDIETTCEEGFPNIETANEMINAITIKFSNIKTKYVFGCEEYNKDVENQEYIKCKNESDLLEKFLELWKSNYPNIITGWNVKYFDIPYIINRYMRLFSAKKAAQFSPWKIVIERMENGNFYGSNAEKVTYNIYGVSVLDYLDLYKKFTYINQESYKLDHIASVELGMKKLDYSEYNSLHLLYKNNFEKFIDYNSRDVDLIIMLEEKMKLIELAITMSYDAKINFDDVFSQVRMWDVIIYNYLLGKNIVIPPKKTNSNNNTIEGAYVKEPLLGQHDWVVSFDLTSLYPHLIMMYNISPETLLPESINATTEIILNKQLLIDNSVAEKYNNNFTIASNGRIFSKQFQGFMPELMEWMFDRRKKFKTQMLNTQKLLEQNKKTATSDQLRQYTNDISKYNNLQMAMKIALNSAYGAMGNPYFRYFDVALAEAVTKSGQTSIRWIENKLNMYFNKLLKTEDVDYIIAVDTDSVYIKFNSIVDTFIKSNNKEKIINTIDKICNEKLTPYINSSYSELSNYVLALPNKMIMKRESIADRGIWTAKKRYILNVHDSEGVRYSEPKLKIMGIEAVRSSTPGSCRANIKEALKIIMNKNEDALITFISDFKERFKTLPVEDIAFPRTANNISKYAMAGNSIYKSGTPIHIRGSLIYNKMLKKLKLTNTYQEIYNGEKIKFVYLKQPNVLHDNVISFKNTLPVEFNIHDCIDYDLQFEKTFIDPLSVITNIIGWNYERTATLESFFE